MADDDRTIRSGGVQYDAAWVRCRAARSFKSGEALVRIDVDELDEPLAFYVDATYVQPSELPGDGEVDAVVRVILLDRDNGTALVQVIGEPVSYGPNIRVSSSQLTTGLLETA